jgi:hypothetical protein
MPFEWAEQGPRENPSEVVFDPETTEAVIALMARLLVTVLRATEEVDDER